MTNYNWIFVWSVKLYNSFWKHPSDYYNTNLTNWAHILYKSVFHKFIWNKFGRNFVRCEFQNIIWDVRAHAKPKNEMFIRTPDGMRTHSSKWVVHAHPETRCACAAQSYICARATLNKLRKRSPKWYMRAHLILVCAGAYHLGLRTRISLLLLVPKAHQLPPSPAPFRICATGLFRKEHPIPALQPVLTYLGHI